ncbi:MAG: hypothetical protein L0332_28185 [Chloroflexi bacterium]|nr:hypothetical protein [Chloroflexota bacterium]MCI0730578.1 hypothetical protein [Chloroflexota bacterium]
MPDNPAGLITYATHSDPPYQGPNSYFAITINVEGELAEASTAISLPPELEADIFQIHPSPNGRYQVWMFASEPGGIPYVYNEATGEAQPLYREAYGGGNFYGWHPDGQHFLFWLDTIGLWLVDAETFEITTLVLPYSIVQGAAFSPDGQTIAYIDANPPDTAGALWFVSIAGSDAVPLLDVGSLAFIHPGAWSPNGTQLIYRGDCPGAEQQYHITTALCLFDIRTSVSQFLKLPFTVAYDAPRWSPDGRYILTTGLTAGKTPCSLPEREQEPVACMFRAQSVYAFDTETGTAVALAEGISPIWSPDGSMIAFLSNSSGAPEVWTIHADGTELRQLTNDRQFKSSFSNLQWVQEDQQ